jgi:hypothetical protein
MPGDVAVPEPGATPDAALVFTWRRQLAILYANRTHGDVALLERLGRHLLQAGQVPAAHACFVLAGAPLQPADAAGAQFVAVGTSPAAAPRTFAALPAIMRTEIFTWARTSGGLVLHTPPLLCRACHWVGRCRPPCPPPPSTRHAQTPPLPHPVAPLTGNLHLVPNYLCVLPYKLLHAAALVDAGLLNQAAQYCAAIATSLQAQGAKLAPGLLVCRAATADLQERLMQHAAAHRVSLAHSFNAGALVSSVGKLLDRGLTALMGDGTHSGQGSAQQGHSRTSSFGAEPAPGHCAGQLPAAAMPSPMVGLSRPSSQRSLQDAGPSSSPPRHPGAGGNAQQPKLLSSWMNRVSSLKNLVAPPAKAPSAAAEPAAGEPENVFYCDTELRQWRERGVEAAPLPAAPPPPPMMTAWQAPSSASPLQHGGVGRYANSFATPSAAGAGTPGPPAAAAVFMPHAADGAGSALHFGPPPGALNGTYPHDRAPAFGAAPPAHWGGGASVAHARTASSVSVGMSEVEL